MSILYSLIMSTLILICPTNQDTTTANINSSKIIIDTVTTEMQDSTRIVKPVTEVINSSKKTAVLVYPKETNNAFKIGEKLTFKIRYGFIRAGTATMSVKEEMSINKRPVYHIQTTAESAAGFSWIYKVEDVIDSYVDKEGLFSWKFDKRLREGDYKADVFVDYIPEDSSANVSFTRYEKKMRRTVITKKDNYPVKVPPFSFDVLAAMYYTRTRDLEVGKSFFMTNHDHKKVYPLEVKVYEKEVLEVEAGTFRCLVVEPLLEGEGIFRRTGRMKIWLTDDEFKIPVQVTSAIVVGSITVELEEIEGINQKIPAMIAPNE